MTDLYLNQEEADALFKMEKIKKDNTEYVLPLLGGKTLIPLVSKNKKEEFLLDINRGRIVLSKNTFQNRARKIFPLCRIDINGPIHVNPDQQEVPTPHMHIYKEGYGDKWAYPLPVEFNDLKNPIEFLDKFMDYCSIVEKPNIVSELLP